MCAGGSPQTPGLASLEEGHVGHLQEEGSGKAGDLVRILTTLCSGVHCDSKGNVYAGCGDGVHIWNPSGKLIGKIYVGATVANFQFVGGGRMVICAETSLYYVTLRASGSFVEEYL